MRVAVACDHAGFPLKSFVLEAVLAAGHEVVDLGAYTQEPEDDYPDYAEKIGRTIQSGEAERGVLLCGSGVGASIAVNKMDGLYSAVCHDVYSAHQGVEHDDMNVLSLGARVIGPAMVGELVSAFLAARFLGNDPGQERHKRRVMKVRQIESGRSVL
jgi:ribose 5-phosphate isomerase B